MARPIDDPAHRSDLDDPPGIHDGDPMRSLGDDSHIVGHQHDRRAVVAPEPFQQSDDLRLDRHIERRRRLVGDNEARVGGERQGDDDPLAHPAGKLVRVMVNALVSGGNADLTQQGQSAASRLSRPQIEMGADRFDELMSDCVERVEARERILKNRADLLAADAPHGLVGQMVDAPPSERDAAAGNPQRRLQQPDDRRASQRFTGTGFADHPQHFARRDVEADIVDRDQRASAGRHLDAKVFDLEQQPSAAHVSAASD